MRNRKTIIAVTIALVLIIATIATLLLMPKPVAKQADSNPNPTPSTSSEPMAAKKVPTEDYVGQEVALGDGFKVKVPNGWRASVSTQPSFLAIQFARPGQLESLVYNEATAPKIDYDGIPAWGGLTEHFYIRSITTASQAFKPADHTEVTQEQFTFTDGTIGTKYSVTKHATEAQKWGGLLKDSQWNGRVYVYEKDGERVEAHLAFYPSTKIDESFYANVAMSIKP